MSPLSRLLRSLFPRPKLSRRERRRLGLETLEGRLTPATYNWDGSDSLSINLETDESLTVSPGESESSFDFILSSGTFTATGATLPGDGFDILNVSGAEFGALLQIRNSAAGSGINDVVFDGFAELTSATIAVDLTTAGTANAVLFSNGFDLTASSSLSLKTTGTIYIPSGSDLANSGSGLTLESNQQPTPTSGPFVGVYVGGTVTTSDGPITIRGRGGDAAGGGQHGILNQGTLSATGAGGITLEGTGGGGDGSSDNDGVRNEGAIFAAAPVSITGTGGVGEFSEGFGNEEFAAIDTSNAFMADISLKADVIFLFPTADAITAGSNAVAIAPVTGGRGITLLGDLTDLAGQLSLGDPELNTISAFALTLGDASTGAITVDSSISLANILNLTLTTDDVESVVFNNSLALTASETLVTINTGSVTSPGNAAADVTASALAVTATTGIGTVTGPLTTSVDFLEAGTSTAGIFIANTGKSLEVGDVSALISGVNVLTSGDISLTNDLSISIDVFGDVVAGPGAVTVRATDQTADLLLAGNNSTSAVTFGAVESTGGLVTLEAGQDVFLGDAEAGTGDVVGVGIDITAGRHVVLDAGAAVISTAAGNVAVVAGAEGGVTGDISLLHELGIGASIVTNGGSIALTTDFGGTVTLDSESSSGTLDTTLGVGDVTLSASFISITDDDAINAGAAIVTLQQAGATAQAIDVGGAGGNSADLTLLDAELDRITAGFLRIGRTDNAGNLAVTAAIDPANVDTLHLRTGGAITDPINAGTPDVTVTNLALTARTGIGSGEDLDVLVTNLAASNSTSGLIDIDSFGPVNVSTVDGVRGLANSAANQGLHLEAVPGSITVEDTLAAFDVFAAGTGVVALFADDGLTVNGGAVVKSDSGTVMLVSNRDDADTGEDVTLGVNASVQTTGNVQLDADPNLDGSGGGLVFGSGFTIQNGSGGPVANLTLTSADDLTLTTFSATTSLTATSTGGNVLDDGFDFTWVAAANITLAAEGRVGGDGAIDPSEVFGQNGDFRGAIDFDLQGGTLTVNQGATGGNVQLREVNGGLSITSLDLAGAVLNDGDQLALIGSGGDLTLDVPLNLAGADADLLLAATANSVRINATVTNDGPTAATNVVVAGTGSIVGPTTADAAADLAGANVGLYTFGGTIGASTAVPLEFNAENLVASSMGGDAFLMEENSVTLLSLDAGTAHLMGGTFTLGGDDTISDTTTVSIDGATLDLDAFSDTVAGAVLVNGTIDGTGTLTALSDFDVRNGTVNAVLAGAVGLDKTTSGTVTLNNDNTYTGTTPITDGTLVLSDTGSTAAASGVAVSGSGVLAGTGTAFGAVTVTSAGTVSPGTSPGTLDVGSAGFQAGSTLTIEFGGPTPGDGEGDHDQVTSDGPVNINGATLNLSSINSYVPIGDETFVLVVRDGGTGSFFGLSEGTLFADFLGSGVTARITYAGGDGDDVAIEFVSVVSVLATVGPADENDPMGNTLEFTISRSGDTSDPLTVLTTLAGTATLTSDYTFTTVTGGARVAGNFVFDAGSDTMVVTYTAVNDVPAEDDETVILTIQPNAAYTVSGTEGSAAGTILANDTAVTHAGNFGEGSLRQAVNNANDFEGADEITFEGSVFGDDLADVINIGPARLTLTDSSRTTITGPGAKMLTIAGGEGGLFFVGGEGGQATITGLKLTEQVGLEGELFNPALEVAEGSDLVLDAVWITGFHSFGVTPGLRNNGTATVTNSTFSDNYADDAHGGAIVNGGTLSLTNVTLSGNRTDGHGGGVFQNAGSTTMAQVTITNNRADADDLIDGDGGGVSIQGGTMTAVNSIISGNLVGAAGTVADVTGANLLTARYSLIGSSDTGLNEASNNNVFATNPQLDPLGDNGGPTPTHLIFPTSPALNGGSNALVPKGLTTDQRGRARIVRTTVDMGATETQVPSFSVRNKVYRGRPGRVLRVPPARGLLAGVVQQGTQPMRAQLVTVPAPRFGRLRLNDNGSFVFAPRGQRAMTVRFTARVFNGQEWSDPFLVTLVFSNRSFGRRI